MRKVFLLFDKGQVEKMTVRDIAGIKQRFKNWSYTKKGSSSVWFTDDFYGCKNNHLYKIGIMMDSVGELDKLPMMEIPWEISGNVLGACVDLSKLAKGDLDEKTFYEDFK